MTVNISHIDHVTLIVTDPVRARDFYGRILGLREIAPPHEFDFAAIWYDLSSVYLHLLVKSEPDTISPRHVCFHVEDIAQARDAITTHGIPISETVKISAADRFFIADPDGNRIEILQWRRPYHPESDGNFSI
jgi:glyoxylase I family protein